MEKCPTCDNYITFNTKCICSTFYAFTTNTVDYTKEYLAINDRTS